MGSFFLGSGARHQASSGFSLSSVLGLLSLTCSQNRQSQGHPDDNVFVPEPLRQLRQLAKQGEAPLSKDHCFSTLNHPGMQDLALVLVTKFLEDQPYEILRFITKWANLQLPPDPKDHEDLEHARNFAPQLVVFSNEIALAKANRTAIPLSTVSNDVGLIFGMGPNAFFEKTKEILRSRDRTTLPIFQNPSGLLSLRAFLNLCIERHESPSFAVYFQDEKRFFSRPEGSRIMSFTFDSEGRSFRSKFLSDEECQALLSGKRPVVLVDNAIHKPDNLRNCENFLRSLQGNRMGAIHYATFMGYDDRRKSTSN